jgi:hypothetical protein
MNSHISGSPRKASSALGGPVRKRKEHPAPRRVRQHLEEYCGLDTLGMVEIVKVLGKF